MKSFFKKILYLFLGCQYAHAQDSPVLLTAKMFDQEQKILLSGLDGWVFREGNDMSWAKKEISTNGK